MERRKRIDDQFKQCSAEMRKLSSQQKPMVMFGGPDYEVLSCMSYRVSIQPLSRKDLIQRSTKRSGTVTLFDSLLKSLFTNSIEDAVDAALDKIDLEDDRVRRCESFVQNWSPVLTNISPQSRCRAIDD